LPREDIAHPARELAAPAAEFTIAVEEVVFISGIGGPSVVAVSG
jgi:hypothetical protein